jgi:hypothetical protein
MGQDFTGTVASAAIGIQLLAWRSFQPQLPKSPKMPKTHNRTMANPTGCKPLSVICVCSVAGFLSHFRFFLAFVAIGIAYNENEFHFHLE